MKNYKSIFPFLLFLLCFSCKNPNLEGGGSMDDKGNTTIDDGSSNSNGTTTEEQYTPPSPSKEIEWADGNTYTYDYTEEIETKDSLGNVGKVFTIYKRNKPVDVNCETKECRWCRKEIYAENYSIEDFPDVDVLRGRGSYSSQNSFYLSVFTEPAHFDINNKIIRTEWKVNCDYGGPDDFCSMKCQSEYNNR
jgi:hypothetical protein